jgi:hypothetical protein
VILYLKQQQKSEDKVKYSFLNYWRNEDEAKYSFLNYRWFAIAIRYNILDVIWFYESMFDKNEESS